MKLTNMGAARACLEDLIYAMEAEDTARIIKSHKAPMHGGEKLQHRHVLSVKVIRGENLLGRGSKPADGFAVITDKESGERLLKSRTVLGAEDPRW